MVGGAAIAAITGPSAGSTAARVVAIIRVARVTSPSRAVVTAAVDSGVTASHRNTVGVIGGVAIAAEEAAAWCTIPIANVQAVIAVAVDVATPITQSTGAAAGGPPADGVGRTLRAVRAAIRALAIPQIVATTTAAADAAARIALPRSAIIADARNTGRVGKATADGAAAIATAPATGGATGCLSIIATCAASATCVRCTATDRTSGVCFGTSGGGAAAGPNTSPVAGGVTGAGGIIRRDSADSTGTAGSAADAIDHGAGRCMSSVRRQYRKHHAQRQQRKA